MLSTVEEGITTGVIVSTSTDSAADNGAVAETDCAVGIEEDNCELVEVVSLVP